MVLAKVLGGFSGLGIISIIPWSLASKEPEIKFKFVDRGGQEMSSKLTQILEEKGEKGYEGCVALTGGEIRGRVSLLYVCINPKEADKSFLFHYDYSAKKQSDKLNAIDRIERKSSWASNVYLKGGAEKNLGATPIWMGNWGKTPFNPKDHCQLTKKNKANYSLTCSIKDVDKPFSITQEIS